MRKLVTIKDNEAFLRQISKEVVFPDTDLEKDFAALKKYTLAHKVFAMASVQIGIAKRLIFVKNTDLSNFTEEGNNHITMVNPVILSKKGRTKFLEGCQSCLQYWAVVERPYEIVVKYQDLTGAEHTEKFEGFTATVLSHEIDHLDGILHMDRAKDFIDLDEKDKEARIAFRNAHPYEIISKDCPFEYPPVKKFVLKQEAKTE